MTPLPPTLAANPRLSAWLRIRPEGTVDVRPGRVELGQGILTALAQVAAEELDVDLARVTIVPATTGLSPNEGYTAGSMSIQYGAAALRVACAEARGRYLTAASRELGVPADKLTVADGEIKAPDGRTTSYWELAGSDTMAPNAGLLDVDATGAYPLKAADAYRIVGTSVPRLDLPAKVTGQPHYVHDLALERQCYGQVVRPPSRGAALKSLDEKPASALAGVIKVVRDGDFLGVVAERMEVALRAADLLRESATWEQRPTLPDPADLPGYLRSAPAETTVLATKGTLLPVGETAPAGETVTSMEAFYHRSYLAHASMGPSSATALYVGDEAADGTRLRVWSHSQGPYPLRGELARALSGAPADITVTHTEGAGCYGHNGADDVALDAALLAMAVPGRPVQVTWSRADELGWAPFGTAGLVRVAADVDGHGNVLSWRHEIWGNGHSTRPGSVPSVSLLAASHREGGAAIDPAGEPPLANGGGAGRNSVPYYDFPAYEVVNHRLLEMPLRTSALRSLGAFLNVFAAESFMDELAAAAGRDPVEYRLSVLSDPQARAVIEAAAARAGGSLSRGVSGDSAGRGIAFARYKNTSAYCAVVADVEAVSEIRVRRLTVAVDAGLIVNPDGAVNQVEGGAIQATSWACKEQVRFDQVGVTSDSWETYPILRFSEVPAVDVELLPGGGNPSLGIGEAAQGPTVAAIGNAIRDALGVRVRTLPFSPENVTAAIPD
ncbi:MAG TPA: molybdopterin cofactor-binding domain-containing protein [Trebonia sp.]